MEDGAANAPHWVSEMEHHELRPFAQDDQLGGPSHGSFLSTASINSCTISYRPFAKGLVYFLGLVTCVPLVAGGAFTSIFAEDGNYNACAWAFFAACLSLGALSLFALHLWGRLERYHDAGSLGGVKAFAMLMSIASGISMGIYLILAFLNKHTFSLRGTNYISSALFGGICLVSSLMLYFTAQWYQNAIQMANRLARLTRATSLNASSQVVN